LLDRQEQGHSRTPAAISYDRSRAAWSKTWHEIISSSADVRWMNVLADVDRFAEEIDGEDPDRQINRDFEKNPAPRPSILWKPDRRGRPCAT